MNSKTLAMMVLGAGLLWGATRLLSTDSPTEPTGRGAQERLFPGLEKNVNQVHTLRLELRAGTFHFVRNSEGTWGLKERSQFRADHGKLDGLVLALARSKRLEQKTSKPGRYSALGLDSEGDEDARPALVRITDGAGKSLAALWVGQRRDRSASEAYFVRIDGEPSCWAASGNLGLDSSMVDWLDSTLVDLASDQVRRVSITQPDGEQVLLERGADAAPNTPLTIANLPEGKEPQSEWVTSRFASALQGLKLQDVKPSSALVVPAGELTRCEVWTTDHLLVTVSTWEAEGLLHAVLQAEYQSAGAATEQADRARVTALALSMNQRFDGWVFILPSWKGSALRGRMAELLKAEGDTADPFGTPGPELGAGPTEHVITVDNAPAAEPEDVDGAPEKSLEDPPAPKPESDAAPDKADTAAPVFEIDPNSVESDKKAKAGSGSPPE
ncbi:MAG: DUF4340 domain-containing protein [Planctomycetes bacterium]|nr:DUF4340 domain-containing protein [Planctomycetota bacterium]